MQLEQSNLDSWPSGIVDRLRSWVEAETGMDFSGNRTQRLRDAADKVRSRQMNPAKLEQLLADSRQRGIFLEQLTTECVLSASVHESFCSHC